MELGQLSSKFFQLLFRSCECPEFGKFNLQPWGPISSVLECSQAVWELNHERANQSILPRIKIKLLLHVPATRIRIYGSCLTELRTISLSDFDLDSSAVLHQNRWSRVRVGHTIARYIDLDSMERSAPSNTLRRGISRGFKIWQNLNPSTREVALLSLTERPSRSGDAKQKFHKHNS